MHGEAPGHAMPLGHRVAAHTATLERIGFLTLLADGKAAPLLALQAAIAGATIAGLDRLQGLLDVDGEGWLTVLLAGALLLGYAACAAVVAALTLAIYFPVTREIGHTLTFFRDIQVLDFQTFQRRSRALHEEHLESELLHQIHSASIITATKYRQLRWAYLLTGLSLTTWLPLMVWASF